MAVNQRIRHYLAMQPQENLATSYAAWRQTRTTQHRRNIHQLAQERLTLGLQRLGLADHVTPHVVAHPSLGWRLTLEGESEFAAPEAEHIWSVEFEMGATGEAALDHLHTIRSKLATHLSDCTNLTMAADLPIFVTDYWSPAEATAPLFGDRVGARRLLGVGDLRKHPGTTGKGVNVVVVDQGVDKVLITRLGGTFGGGWEYLHDAESGATITPGQTKGGHGAMMVRNILDVAPEVTIFDCPMLPPRITSIRHFLSHADAAYARMLGDIRYLRDRDARWRGPWVFVNAWAIYDRQSERPMGDYTDNPHHRFNRLIAQAVDERHDVVFCAGNCGQFCPVMRCGTNDRGPGHSIYGANSHPSVLTVGAVRVDGLWLGYSSQGPGQSKLAGEKPDLCAPSQFAEMNDAWTDNTGSSAASALVAGVVAALRSRWNAQALPPDQLKQVLMASARKTEGNAWNGRLGHGVLNAGAAYLAAMRRQPA
jgi:subtilisin family serine protease